MPLSVRVPVPFLISPPVPLITPEISLVPLLAMVRLLAPRATASSEF